MIKGDTGMYISSKVIVPELILTYRIESTNFIPKFPMWACQALGELNLYQAYVDTAEFGKFSEAIIKQPYSCREIVSLEINGVVAKEYNAKCKKRASTWLNRDIKTPATNTITRDLNREYYTISDDKHNTNKPCEVPYFNVDGGWIHTNIRHGEYKLVYRTIPLEYDSETELTFPLIYDEELLKKYIRNYTLKCLLYSGWKHELLDLTANNQFINPALENEQIKVAVRNACNRITNTRRNEITEILYKWNYQLFEHTNGTYRLRQG